MQSRQRMVYRIQEKKVPVSVAAREAGVSRPTAYRWLRRAEEVGLAALRERSRRPWHSPRRTAPEIENQVLTCKEAHPAWGAKKIQAFLWSRHGSGEAPISVRTVDRILARHGLTRNRAHPQQEVQRFERPRCNELWQMDFKGMGHPRVGYWPLSVLDDHSRFALTFEPVERQKFLLVWGVLWRLFGEFGLPEKILTDRGSCFVGTWGQPPSRLEAHLWLLGIDTSHGRPYHPQTQGKVERFHRTVDEELSAGGESVRQPTMEDARRVYQRVRHSYNWERPHEALEMRVPGEVYLPSERKRPDAMPRHELPEGVAKRKVQDSGEVYYRGRVTRVSRGLRGEHVEVRELDSGIKLYFAGREVGHFPD